MSWASYIKHLYRRLRHPGTTEAELDEEVQTYFDVMVVDITAKPPTGYQHAQLQALLQNLLTDRFKLAVHHESKEVPAFALVVAKGGS